MLLHCKIQPPRFYLCAPAFMASFAIGLVLLKVTGLVAYFCKNNRLCRLMVFKITGVSDDSLSSKRPSGSPKGHTH